ncbi:DUF4398 domain-containing protein [Roseateles violae]|uniref:DUF4398 domain-containing protein n=1 Tax=Roseateles violae TaxID=3058042 RepID=A0ABT8E086_9BURK|nr:DUF4398 domain-containing protein [Pelomonas sp. PFR6]MDN3923268.1 DUF4398 domain-containing protein [Pelomonas sp. PFR6]
MNANKLIHVPTAILAVTAIAWLGACASTPAPKTEMAVAEAAVKNATTTNTSENAPLELQKATAKLASAQQAMAKKDYERARELAQQAQVDAQVAELHAQSVRSRKAAQESQDAARVLDEELSRKTTR